MIKLKFYLILFQKVIMKLMERGLDFYIDKPYNLLY